MRCSNPDSRRCEPDSGFRLQNKRNPEVGQQSLTLKEQDVLRLDIAVNDSLAMGIIECRRYLLCYSQRLLDRKSRVAIQACSERITLNVRHDVVQKRVCFTRIDEGDDVRVTEPCRNVDLLTEALWPEHRGKLWFQDLNCDISMVPEILGEIDGGHATAAELTLDPVSPGERRLKTFELRVIIHVRSLRLRCGSDGRLCIDHNQCLRIASLAGSLHPRLDVRQSKLLHHWSRFPLLRRVLKRMRHLQHAPLAAMPPDDLQPYRQSTRAKCCRRRDRRIRHELHVPTRPHPVDVRRHFHADAATSRARVPRSTLSKSNWSARAGT